RDKNRLLRFAEALESARRDPVLPQTRACAHASTPRCRSGRRHRSGGSTRPGEPARLQTVSDMSDYNPCMSCGICCTHFRISFYGAEGDDAPGGFVPADMTEKLNDHMRCMKGSNSVPRRCAALAGEVGS